MRMGHEWVSALVLAGLAASGTGAAEPPDPADEVQSAWNEAVNGPLPRWRESGTPEAPAGQRLTPLRVELAQTTDAPSACAVDSPPEYAPTDGVLMRFNTAAWPAVVTDVVAALTGDPAHDEVAYVVVANATVQSQATTQFQAAGADMTKVKFIQKPTDSIWLRDYGPHFIWQGGARAVADSHYYPDRPLDNFIPTLVADDYFREPSYDINLYYSGGNFQPGPQRTGFVTGLINLDNPSLSNEFIAELYDTYQGIDTLHILPKLPGSVDGTGHIDMWFYLVDDDTVIISEFVPGSNQTAIDITNNAVPYMEALGFEVFRVPAKNIGAVHYTYTNAFRVNDRIFIPTYGEGSASFLPLDAEAIATWQTAAGPGVEIVGINSWSIIPAAGAIHCIVMQVPRHVDNVPSNCVTSPIGGETLIAGKKHTVTWAATDDQSLQTIEVHYSTDDGSNWEPVALALPGSRDSHAWTVPLLESETALVKVVANDGESNSTEAISPTPFTIATALQHVYDFSSGAGVDKSGWGHQTASWANLNGIRKPATLTALSAASYAKLAASDATGGDTDANRYISAVPAGTWETTHVFEFTIEEDPAKIVDIALLWEGYADQCVQMELYVWDYLASQWTDTHGRYGDNRSVDNFAGNIDEALSGHIRDQFDRYINPSGQMTLLQYADRPGQESFHDYISVTVSYEACAGVDADFDGWADACDNCPDTATTDQADDDNDTRGNVCDCAPSDASAFELPHEIVGLMLESKTQLLWDSAGPTYGSGTTYDVLRGAVHELSMGYGTDCLVSDWNAPEWEDTDTPGSGLAYYYLVRGGNNCGVGGYGTDSEGFERESDVCP